MSRTLAVPACFLEVYVKDHTGHSRALEITCTAISISTTPVILTALTLLLQKMTWWCALVQVLDISRRGLVARGKKEEPYLAPLDRIAASGVTLADALLAKYHEEWQDSADPAYGEPYQF